MVYGKNEGPRTSSSGWTRKRKYSTSMTQLRLSLERIENFERHSERNMRYCNILILEESEYAKLQTLDYWNH